MSLINPPATVLLIRTDGYPIRMVRESIRYRGTDEPYRLRTTVNAPWMTHPLEPLIGLRFRGTNSDGHSRRFDVRRRGDLGNSKPPTNNPLDAGPRKRAPRRNLDRETR